MPTAAPIDELIGQRLAGRYEVLAKLGQGGMGTVYTARQAPLGRTVAIKVLLHELARDPVATARFEKEALAISRLSHPNIVTIFDFGTTDQGLMYIVMEYLDGYSLRELLKREAPLSPKRSVRVVMHIARALAEAHRAGIIHRDLKPDNIQLVTTMGEPDFVKVLDFGVAKLRPRLEEPEPGLTLTQGNVIVGTPKYMSPEQINGITDDPRTDLYALGIIAFECLTGRVPFDGEAAVKILVKHLQEQRPMVREVFPECRASELLEELVASLMAREALHRPPSAARLLEMLEDLPEYTGPRSRSNTVAGGVPMAGPGHSAPTGAGVRPAPRLAAGSLPNGVRLDGFHRAEPTGAMLSPREPTLGSVSSPALQSVPRLLSLTADGEPMLPTAADAAEMEEALATEISASGPALADLPPELTPGRATPRPARRRKKPLGVSVFLGAGVVAAGLGASSVVLWSRLSRPPPPALASSVPPAVPERAPEPPRQVTVSVPAVEIRSESPAKEPSKLVRVTVTSTPEGAEVLEGTTVRGITPVQLALPRGGSARLLTLRLAGHKDAPRALVPDRDRTLEVVLVAEAKEPAAAPTAEAPAEAAKDEKPDRPDRSAPDKAERPRAERAPRPEKARPRAADHPKDKSPSRKNDHPEFEKFDDFKDPGFSSSP